MNQGVAATCGDLILVLNPDCRLLPAAVGTLVAEIRNHPDCAIAAPEILNDDGGIQGNARGDPNMLTGLFGRSTVLTRAFPGSRVARRNVQLDAAATGALSREVDWVSGACMLIRRDAFEAVHGFDERYFLYWEDADLCRRLRARGYKIRHVPSARVIHTAGQSSRAARALAIRAFHRSAYTYYATHVARTRPARLLARVLLEGRCRWKLLVDRDTDSVRAPGLLNRKDGR
jgi:GT2 family glycosyltransferase